MSDYLAAKDPADIAPYSFEFEGPGVDGETVNVGASSVTLTGATLVPGSVAWSGLSVVFGVSGGTANTLARVTVRLVTNGGLTIERSRAIPIREL